jgi:hypothetical protein
MTTTNDEPEQLIIRWASEVQPRPPRQWPAVEIDYKPHAICPGCSKTHTRWYTVAKCRWKSADWIAGDPPAKGPAYATVSYCGRNLTVILHALLADAQSSLAIINKTGCGGSCTRRHRLVEMGTEGDKK